MNIEATIAYVIHRIIIKVDRKEKPKVNYTTSRKYEKGLKRNIRRKMFQFFPGIGFKRAIEIENSDYSTIEKLVKIVIAEIESISKIGNKKAQTIYSARLASISYGIREYEKLINSQKKVVN